MSKEVFLGGSSELSAVSWSLENGFQVYHVDNLHAKAYIFGDCSVVGSANCTNRGLGLNNDSKNSLEYLVCIDKALTDPLLEEIEQRCSQVEMSDVQEMRQSIQLGIDEHVNSSEIQMISRYLEKALFPSRQPFEIYVDAIKNLDEAMLPAGARLALRKELDQLEIGNCYGSRSALKRSLLDFFHSQESIRFLSSLLHNRNEKAIRLCSAHHNCIYWIDWINENSNYR